MSAPQDIILSINSLNELLPPIIKVDGTLYKVVC